MWSIIIAAAGVEAKTGGQIDDAQGFNGLELLLFCHQAEVTVVMEVMVMTRMSEVTAPMELRAMP